jgi:hypothetical protein
MFSFMGNNPGRQKEVYSLAAAQLDRIARSEAPEGLESCMNKFFVVFQNGYPVPTGVRPESDYANRTLQNLIDYATFVSD